MKICIVLPEYFPVPAVRGGAVETLVEDILRINEKYKKLDIVCVTKKDKNAKLLFERYPHTRFKTINFASGKTDFILKAINFIIRKFVKKDFRKNLRIYKYNKKILSEDFDLIIFEGANNYINEQLVKKVGKEKLILHLHKVYEPNLEWEKYFRNFISLSKYATKEFCKGNVISRGRVQTLLNGVNFEKFNRKVNHYEIQNLKDKYSITEEDIVLLYIGRLLPEKGVKELIISFKNMKNKSNCKLLIVGSAVSSDNSETKYTKELYEIAKSENIIFTGYIPNDELYKYYKLADFAIFPSTGPEGLGLVVIEAMGCGLATIITNSGGMPELVSEDTSKVVNLDKDLIDNLTTAMDELSVDEELRGKMGNSALELAKKYNSENYYLGYLQCLKNIKDKG